MLLLQETRKMVSTITVHFVILYKENTCLKVLNLTQTHKTFLFLGDDGDKDGK